MWLDLARFYHFCNILQIFGKFLKLLFSIWRKKLYLVYIVTKGQILINNLWIRSHCKWLWLTRILSSRNLVTKNFETRCSISSNLPSIQTYITHLLKYHCMADLLLDFELVSYVKLITDLTFFVNRINSGQSYKATMIAIYDSRVVPDLKISHIMTLDL